MTSRAIFTSLPSGLLLGPPNAGRMAIEIAVM